MESRISSSRLAARVCIGMLPSRCPRATLKSTVPIAGSPTLNCLQRRFGARQLGSSLIRALILLAQNRFATLLKCNTPRSTGSDA
jgi:hypothetical protein